MNLTYQVEIKNIPHAFIKSDNNKLGLNNNNDIDVLIIFWNLDLKRI